VIAINGRPDLGYRILHLLQVHAEKTEFRICFLVQADSIFYFALALSFTTPE